MNNIASTVDLNMEALDVVEAPLDGYEVLLYGVAFGVGLTVVLVAT
ncbi:MAG TPA: hypothetical protein VF619_01785 [Allosphingosinicella sp.]|jgi:hypothetical protein